MSIWYRDAKDRKVVVSSNPWQFAILIAAIVIGGVVAIFVHK
jgi:hypothetical protein